MGGDIPLACAHLCDLGQAMDLPSAMKCLREAKPVVLESGSRPANAAEVATFIEEIYGQVECTTFMSPKWCRVATTVPAEFLRPEEKLALLEREVAAREAAGQAKAKTEREDAGQAKAKTEVGVTQVRPREVVDLTSVSVRQGAAAYFLEPFATTDTGKEVLEDHHTRLIRMAAFGLLARCTRPHHPHILASFPEGDVAGVLAAIRTLGKGSVASQIWTQLRWLGSTTVESAGLPAYLTKLASIRAFLTANATGTHAVGSALLLEAALQAAADSPALSADMALARRDGTTIEEVIAAWTRRSMDPASTSLGANVAMGARARPNETSGPVGTPRPKVIWPKDTNPFMLSEVPAGVCWMHIRSGKSPCVGGCAFKHDPALRASYLAGKFLCRSCKKRHTPRHCPGGNFTRRANVAAVAEEGEEDDGELGACVAGLSGLEELY